jgi:protein-L-isoaspartate(D-aspartate) O-methyltransferase
MIADLRRKGIRDQRVLRAMESIPREVFVSPELRDEAYRDGPLPIGYGQTISQPFIVGRMTELLALSPEDRVLEIGAGCGYQTAVLSRLVARVFSLERLPALARLARANLRELNISNVTVKSFDGTHGWKRFAPFDGILSAAVGPDIPPTWLEQLSENGRLVLPVQVGADDQRLFRIQRRNGQFVKEECGGVRFVPLIGRFGFSEAAPKPDGG